MTTRARQTKQRPQIERFRLQFGPYAPPKVPRKNRLLCEMRGYLKVSPTWSDGLIPWPRRYQTGSIILCGDLVPAVKMESVEAICYHWGVCRNVVQNWRHALGVPEFNPGTRQLFKQLRAGADSPTRQRAMERAKRPSAILRREIAPHETAHPLVRPSTSLLVRERMARTGRHINPALRLWTAKEDKLLGTARDRVIAKRIHRSEAAVRARRTNLGFPAWHASYSKPWTPQEDALLGIVPDRVLAKRLKRTFLAVQARRENLSIPLLNPKVRPWTGVEEKLLGTDTDRNVARRLGRTYLAVQIRRELLGVLPSSENRRVWLQHELALLGTKPDAEVAKLLGRSISSVRSKRQDTAFARPEGGKLWTQRELELLGTKSDPAIAHLLGRSASAVKAKRRGLGIRRASI